MVEVLVSTSMVMVGEGDGSMIWLAGSNAGGGSSGMTSHSFSPNTMDGTFLGMDTRREWWARGSRSELSMAGIGGGFGRVRLCT